MGDIKFLENLMKMIYSLMKGLKALTLFDFLGGAELDMGMRHSTMQEHHLKPYAQKLSLEQPCDPLENEI